MENINTKRFLYITWLKVHKLLNDMFYLIFRIIKGAFRIAISQIKT